VRDVPLHRALDQRFAGRGRPETRSKAVLATPGNPRLPRKPTAAFFGASRSGQVPLEGRTLDLNIIQVGDILLPPELFDFKLRFVEGAGRVGGIRSVYRTSSDSTRSHLRRFQLLRGDEASAGACPVGCSAEPPRNGTPGWATLCEQVPGWSKRSPLTHSIMSVARSGVVIVRRKPQW
jgi:hypothetical protein